MKIISLNTWGGRAGKEKLLGFFAKHHDDIDVFCLQEIWSAPYKHLDGCLAGGTTINQQNIMVYGKQDISKTLPDYKVYFHPHHLDNYGLMMMVKQDLKVVATGEIFVYKYKGYLPEGDAGKHARNIQYVTLKTSAGLITIINFHGLWNGRGKTDSEDRLMQSANILAFTKKLNNPFIICGDFNLAPETQSLKMFEEVGLKNLIKDYGIKSTRTSCYTKPEKHASYVFVSNNIEIKSFQILPDEVSDHLPLLFETN